MVMIQNIIERANPKNTFFPYSFSQNRYAMEAFTVLFDMTARRIVVEAINRGIDQSFAPSLIAKFTASTSAKPDISQRK